MAFDSSQDSFRSLERLIRAGERKVVPFIGAGLSTYGSVEERLPLWNQLLWKMKERAAQYGLLSPEESEEVRLLIESKQLITATDMLLNCMGEKQFRLFVEEIFDVSGKQIPPAITELITISWSLIVTTNLDSFIEKAWAARHGSPIDVATSADTIELAQAISGVREGSTLAKIHGTVERYETWILSTRHYASLLNKNQAYVNSMQNLFLRIVFFIGYGLNDDDLQTFLDQINMIYPAGVGTFFALLDSKLRGTPELQSLVRSGVKPIWFNYDPSCETEPDCGYGEVLECLQILVQAWVRAKKAVPLKLKYFPELEPDFIGRTNELQKVAEHLLSKPPLSVQIVGFGGEGKTSLVQQFLEIHREDLAISSYQAVFGCSFYRADVGRFINDAYLSLHPSPHSLDVASKVSELSNLFTSTPILLILDGIEAVQKDDGSIANPYLEDILAAAINGKTTLLVTTRVPLPYNIERLYLDALSEEDTAQLLGRWGHATPPNQLRRFIRKTVGGHALSVRILAAMMKGRTRGSMGPLDMSLLDAPDEVDRLRANKAKRVLEYYQEHLTEVARVFMECFSVFRRPIAVSTVLTCFSAITSIATFTKGDLRPVIQDLLERRLLIVETGSLLTVHPLVREYFSRQISVELGQALHREIARYYVECFEGREPRSFDEYLILFDACYHAASSEDWTFFHNLFFHRLNREHENYIGNTLGAWEEFVELVSLTFPCRDLSGEPVIYPAYYRSAAARGLKHLGRSLEARKQYIACIKLSAVQQEGETARYINNFLSLSISMGDLVTACKLAPLNAGTLKWIDIEWRRRWQTEFALFSIGYLYALTGDLQAGEAFCHFAEHVWDEQKGDRRWFFDYYRPYYVDVILASGGKREIEAIAIAQHSLEIGEKYAWKETTGAALRSLSSAHRSCFISHPSRPEFLDTARLYVGRAQEIVDDIRVPRLEIDVLLERVRIELASYIAGQDDVPGLRDIDRARDRIIFLVEQCRFDLYRPELYALNSWLSLIRGLDDQARRYYEQAIASALAMGNIMIIKNKCGLLEPLGHKLYLAKYDERSHDQYFMNLNEFFSRNLSPKEVMEVIIEIEATKTD